MDNSIGGHLPGVGGIGSGGGGDSSLSYSSPSPTPGNYDDIDAAANADASHVDVPKWKPKRVRRECSHPSFDNRVVQGGGTRGPRRDS